MKIDYLTLARHIRVTMSFNFHVATIVGTFLSVKNPIRLRGTSGKPTEHYKRQTQRFHKFSFCVAQLMTFAGQAACQI
jgi:hypothetical protein